MQSTIKTIAACALLAGAGSAFPHATLLEPAALAGTSYRAAFKIGHGCAGSPTTALQVFLPEGVRGARPMPKPGWTLEIRTAVLSQPYTSHGKQVTEDVVEVRWRANSPDSALQDGWYDEFVLSAGLPAAAGPLWFRVVQTCAQGSLDWSQQPSPGAPAPKFPAVLLEVLPAQAGGHQH